MKARHFSKTEHPVDGHKHAKNKVPLSLDLNKELLVSVVIPARNEARKLPHILPYIPKWVYEVVLVDGHPNEDTLEFARELRPDIRMVDQEGRGKGNALRRGFAAARGEIIVILDADDSTCPEEICAFVGALLSGPDFVKGSRFLRDGGPEDMPFIVSSVTRCS